MIEHLVSPGSMVQFLKLTSLIQSDHPAAEAFRGAFLDYQQRCNHDVTSGECNLCEESCLRDSLDCEKSDGPKEPER